MFDEGVNVPDQKLIKVDWFSLNFPIGIGNYLWYTHIRVSWMFFILEYENVGVELSSVLSKNEWQGTCVESYLQGPEKDRLHGEHWNP